MLKKDLEIFYRNNINIQNIISMGGGAKSRLWNQIKADITGMEILIPGNTETALLGASIIAGVGIGAYKDYNEALEKITKIKKTYKPNPDNEENYTNAFKKYNDLYKKIEFLF